MYGFVKYLNTLNIQIKLKTDVLVKLLFYDGKTSLMDKYNNNKNNNNNNNVSTVES